MQRPLELLRPYLEPDERVLWSGRPRQGIVVRLLDAVLIPFSLLAGAFIVFWLHEVLYGETTRGLPADVRLFMAAFAIPVFLADLYLIVGRFLTDSMYRASLTYAVTDQRVLVLSHLITPRLTSFDLATVQGLQLEESQSSRGTIHITPDPSSALRNGWGFWHASIGHPPMLFQVEGARRAFDLIRQASAKSRQA